MYLDSARLPPLRFHAHDDDNDDDDKDDDGDDDSRFYEAY